jgi:hypothetical protein
MYMANKSIKQLQKEGQSEAKQELEEKYGDISQLPPLVDPNTPQIDEKTKQPIIKARDAEIGKDYLTAAMYYKVTILQKYGDEECVSGVQVQAEGAYKPVAIAGGTDLIAYQEQFHTPRISEFPEEKEIPTNPKEKPSMVTKEKASKSSEPKLKMSSIILPMLAEAKHTAAAIADAVIAKFPEKKREREKLISQIEGPRLYNMLKNKEQWVGGKTPGVKEDASKPPKKDKTPEKKEKKVPEKKDKTPEKKEKKAPEKQGTAVPPAA